MILANNTQIHTQTEQSVHTDKQSNQGFEAVVVEQLIFLMRESSSIVSSGSVGDSGLLKRLGLYRRHNKQINS